MVVLLIKVFRDIQRRPLRSLLTVIGITLGVAGLVAINHTGRNLADAQRATYASARQPDFTVFVRQISPTLQDLVARQDNIRAVETRMVRSTRTSAGGGWFSTRLVGIENFRNPTLAELRLTAGSFPQRGEVVYDSGAREILDLRIGDTVALQESGGAPVRYLTVSGFVQVPGALDPTVSNRASAFIPAAEARQFDGRRYNNYLIARVDDPERASHTASEVTRLLNRRGIATGSPSIRDPEVFTGSRELETLLILLRVFSIIGLALSGFLVTNTIAAVMVEETRQVGIIKAVGGSGWSAIGTYLFFAIVIGLLGAIVGLALGLLGGRMLMSYLAGLSGLFVPGFTVSWSEVAWAFGVGVGVVVGAAIVPTWINSRRRIAELLGNIGVVANFRRGLVQRVTVLASRAGTIFAMGIRNLARRPSRALITIVVVAVAVSAFLGTTAVNQSVSYTVDSLYSLYDGEAWVSFEESVVTGFDRQLEDHPEVRNAEPWTNANGSFGATTTTVWGMPADTSIYKPRIVAGEWLPRTNPTSVVLSKNLAEHIGARSGQILTLDIGGGSTVVQVGGIVDDESTYLGADSVGKTFIRIDDQQRLLGRGQVASIFALQLESQEPSEVDRILNDIETTYERHRPVTVPMYQDQESARRVIGILTLMLNAMVTIVGVVGLAGIVNTLIINLTERRREFGILRSVGASRRHLIRLIMTEGVALGGIGYIVGMLIGYPLSRYLVDLTSQQLFGLDFQFSLTMVLGSAVVTILASAAVALGPGLVASRIRPIQVLRYE